VLRDLQAVLWDLPVRLVKRVRAVKEVQRVIQVSEASAELLVLPGLKGQRVIKVQPEKKVLQG